jgi:hypothetical protein
MAQLNIKLKKLLSNQFVLFQKRESPIDCSWNNGRECKRARVERKKVEGNNRSTKKRECEREGKKE